MKVANGLSLLRVFLTPPLLVLLLWTTRWGLVAATVFWLLASISDVLDGYFARRWRVVSKLGVFIDLVADKLMTASVLIALIEILVLPAWPVVVVVGREFIVSGFRTFAAAEGVVIPAAGWGKRKTAVTNLAIGMLMLREDVRRDGPTSEMTVLAPMLEVAPWLFYLAVLLTITSGARYIYSGRGLLKRLAS
ncbi:MAG: CDP-diacylglycerol--glycerol-3-phosphate 3-phosphatidyltransferase [Chloroflexota bacterium]|nr:CDP-diacylglycerol--glycerol-3-phosphate 3-phosphatidyltransferase [Chloroflexota bacterium]